MAQDDDLTFLESTSSDPNPTEEATVASQKSRWAVSRSELGREKEQDREGRILDIRSVIEEGFRKNPH